MGMILRIASSRIVGQGDIVGRSGYFSLNLSANSVMRGRLDARRTLKSLVADLRLPVSMKKPAHTYILTTGPKTDGIISIMTVLQTNMHKLSKSVISSIKTNTGTSST